MPSHKMVASLFSQFIASDLDVLICVYSRPRDASRRCIRYTLFKWVAVNLLFITPMPLTRVYLLDYVCIPRLL